MHIDFNVIAPQMVYFAILLFIGYVAAKAKVLTPPALDALSKFVVTIAMPAMLLTVVPATGNRDTLLSMWPFLLSCFALFPFLTAMGALTAKLLKLKGATKEIHIAETAFGNTTFMGIPLVTSLFGDVGMRYLSVYIIADQIITWTLGVYLTGNNGSEKMKLKKLINPASVALVIALTFVLFNYSPDPKNIVVSTLKGVGDTTKYISMIYVGGVLAGIDMKKALKTVSLYMVVLTKMIAAPVIFAFLLKDLGFLTVQEITILAFIACLPSMVLISILARNSGSDYDYATESVFVTTVCCIFTIPTVAMLLGLFL